MKSKKKSDQNIGIVSTQEEVARALGVSTRTVQYWCRDGMPVKPDGKYDLLEVQAWRLTKNNKTSESDKTKEQWESKYREYKALLAEIEYKKINGELLDKNEVEEGRVKRIMEVKRKLLGLPKKVAPQLVGLEIHKIEAILDLRIKEVINDFARNEKKKA